MNLDVSEDHSAAKKSCIFEPYRKHKNIGKCLIISNEHFPDSPHLHRKGGSVDERLLSSTFKSLGFQVQVEKNLSANEMISVLRKVSKENHTDNSCFVCVLMSHGEEGTILGSDERWIHVKTLTSLVTSDLCPSLRDKPKLFFLQACRGLEYDPGVEADSEEAPGEYLGISDVPEADFLCCYSTVEGYYSWRNPEKGSVFIGELCKMLKDSHLEIIQILTRVNHHVAFHFQSCTTDPDTHRKRQMPCFASKLTKDFYLHVAEKKKK
ncbi:caspase 21, apoptosis-related cysteine peptidase [Pimephales promelas]|uniref:caspase 21, apoptosis-related cysteine peptidase n=1 Tax=Pimephales promelas TaxID=90988 RepID=UPI0019554D9F|nr:caspase 21, apoptosis-related cysteine peptidase [Pimephales promelas]KAG1942126.1 caspase-7 [Pimephales promelas]KAG1942128.1 caspase-7 [Pimephales promelas]